MTYQEIVKALRKEASMKKEASPISWMNALKGTRPALNQALPTLPGQKFNEGVPNLGKGYYKQLSNNIYKTTPLQAAGAYAKDIGKQFLQGASDFINPVGAVRRIFGSPLNKAPKSLINSFKGRAVNSNPGAWLSSSLGSSYRSPAVSAVDPKLKAMGGSILK